MELKSYCIENISSMHYIQDNHRFDNSYINHYQCLKYIEGRILYNYLRLHNIDNLIIDIRRHIGRSIIVGGSRGDMLNIVAVGCNQGNEV